MLDIFNNDAFSVVTMTDAINEMQFVPGRIAELNLFDAEGVDTTTIGVEKKGDILVLVAPSPRGGPGQTIEKDKRELRQLRIPHFEINDAVYADEVQGVRAFGTDRQLETVVGKVASRQRIHVNSMAATEEHARLGAVKGIVTYADGSTLDLFREFDVAPPALYDLTLPASNANPDDGIFRLKASKLIRSMTDDLAGLGFTGIHAFVGDNAFDAILTSKELRQTYLGWNEAQILRDSYVGPNRSSYGVFQFGGIVWENYRGAVGTTAFIEPDEIRAFPVGVPGLFQTRYAPADYEETVNTIGQRLYAKQYPMQNGKGRNLDTQMNALQYCARPKVLRRLKVS